MSIEAKTAIYLIVLTLLFIGGFIYTFKPSSNHRIVFCVESRVKSDCQVELNGTKDE